MGSNAATARGVQQTGVFPVVRLGVLVYVAQIDSRHATAESFAASSNRSRRPFGFSSLLPSTLFSTLFRRHTISKVVDDVPDFPGDGPVALYTFDTLESLKRHHQLILANKPDMMPNTKKAIELACSTEVFCPVYSDQVQRRKWWDTVEGLIKPVFDYFRKKVYEEGAPQLAVFRALRLFDPTFMAGLSEAAVLPSLITEDLAALKFVQPFKDALKSELSTYRQLASNHDGKEALSFFRAHEEELPTFAAMCRKAVLMVPSSAGAERVLSFLKRDVSDHQHQKLSDIRTLHVMMKYNDRSLRPRGGPNQG